MSSSRFLVGFVDDAHLFVHGLRFWKLGVVTPLSGMTQHGVYGNGSWSDAQLLQGDKMMDTHMWVG